MKYLKLFESSKITKYWTKDKPRIGDYVYCQEVKGSDDDQIGIEIDNFLENNIGQIIKKSDDNAWDVIVKYEDTPEKLRDCFNHDNIDGGRRMDIGEIMFWDKDPEMVKIKMNVKKYNL